MFCSAKLKLNSCEAPSIRKFLKGFSTFNSSFFIVNSSLPKKIKVYSQNIEAYGLIFPLTGEHFDLCFIDRNLNHYSGPIGSLDNVGDVLQLLGEG
jgi:hypothetical protein